MASFWKVISLTNDFRDSVKTVNNIVTEVHWISSPLVPFESSLSGILCHTKPELITLTKLDMISNYYLGRKILGRFRELARALHYSKLYLLECCWHACPLQLKQRDLKANTYSTDYNFKAFQSVKTQWMHAIDLLFLLQKYDIQLT